MVGSLLLHEEKWAFTDGSTVHLLASGDEIRVFLPGPNEALVYAGHVWLEGQVPLDIPIDIWQRWFARRYPAQLVPRPTDPAVPDSRHVR